MICFHFDLTTFYFISLRSCDYFFHFHCVFHFHHQISFVDGSVHLIYIYSALSRDQEMTYFIFEIPSPSIFHL